MFRGTTARSVIALLVAALLTLQFFAPSASFASAHTARHAEAKSEPRNKPRVTSQRDEYVTCGDGGRHHDPSLPLRTRDRHRVVDSGPQVPERPLLSVDPAAPAGPDRRVASRHQEPRSPAAHTPAALQVFRC
ncbi:hypothetical protein ACOT81_46070 [Streptomyces sp. WI04-05B]|uniref:hypothetical protein n=1 Tax=Streptomyces TaxID=1883 RepID=UPI0029A3BD95|nr:MULTISPECIES: hypothetical protein [unclassified Streptomyces]MDX2546586.1 hypothetical protein [Streptomyces sp. WI04-05B]MDX2587782.1 hypothetical protein [Streptomyces sp. WI04-05A]MDX3751620.1 hypothetical protein [Streptomyces sp. AK08-02]